MREERRPARYPRASRAVAVAVAALFAIGVSAQAQLSSGKSHDTSLPIEITADSLEVQQDENLAIFRGNVDAVQGDLNIRADQITVHYRTDENGKNAVKLIEAAGNVFLSASDATAQGDKGVYDVDAERIEIVGSVVLTRNENVIRGDRLNFDLANGKSKMEGGIASTGKDGRVKALFVPKAKPQPE